MEYLLLNKGRVRVLKQSLQGEEHLVAPLTLIVSGVLNGSQGPLLYPEEELSRRPSMWNGVPMTLGHPVVNGRPVSARDPDVLDRFGLGILLNARWDKENKKLVADGWFNIKQLKEVAPKVLNHLEAGQPIELSTGLLTTNELTSGVHNGARYEAIARDYIPDHLAVLIDQPGACSLNDGCGVLVNAEGELEVVSNELSHDQLRSMLQEQVAKKYGPDAYVVDVFDRYFVFRSGEAIMKAPYMTDLRTQNGNVDVDFTMVKDVERVTKYVTRNSEEDNLMAKAELIDQLVANCSCWEDADRETLNNFSEDKLSKLVEAAVANKKKVETPKPAKVEETPAQPEPVANAQPKKEEPKELSLEDFWKIAPKEVRDVVQNAMNVESSRKAQLIETITANEQCAFTEDDLKAMTVNTLENLAKLASAESKVPARVANYFGQAGANVQPKKVELESLETPY